uniref:Ig-like domain-containing protein n=1 Tax=Leptobrachium leishanense TaxID=445787 RepID=A0A8C5PSA1_9ANUR
MACLGFLAAFLTLLHQTGALLKISTSSPQRALAGSTVLFHCIFSGQGSTADPRFLVIMWFYQGKEIVRYHDQVQISHPRVTFDERAARSGNASILLSDVKIEDEGIYSCLVIYSLERTEADIILDVLVSPKIQIPDKSVHGDKEKTLVCSVRDFYPGDITITWLRDGEILRNSSSSKRQINENGTYSVDSTVTITPDHERKKQTFSCRVQHESLPVALQDDFQLVYKDAKWNRIIVICGAVILVMIAVILFIFIFRKLKNLREAPGRFKLNDIKGPEKLIDGEEIILYCIGSNCAENTQVTWLEQRGSDKPEIIRPSSGEVKEEETLLDRSYEICDNREGSWSYSSSLRFIMCLGKHKGVKFICRFTSDNETQEKHFRCKPVYVKPRLVDRVKPSLCVSGEILYSLRLDGFYPRHIQILWTCVTGERQEIISSEEQLVEHSPLTFSVCSEARISEKVFTDPSCKVRVTWEHGSMDQPQSREMSI